MHYNNSEKLTFYKPIVNNNYQELKIMIIIPLLNQMKFIARNTICSWNLGGIGNSLSAYAFGYRDEYPIQGAGTHAWGTMTTGWDNPRKNWKQSTGTMTVASSLFLLIRENDIGMKSFICVSSDQQSFVNETDHDVVELWDFGPNPTDHLSYSYQFPYGKFLVGGTLNSANALMADRSPWFDNKLTASVIENESRRTYADKVSLIDTSKGARSWKTRIGNSQVCGRKGQNVLFNDGHVEFTRRPDVGFEDDADIDVISYHTHNLTEIDNSCAKGATFGKPIIISDDNSSSHVVADVLDFIE